MGSVEDAIAKRIGVVGVTDGGVPLLDGKLCGDERRATGEATATSPLDEGACEKRLADPRPVPKLGPLEIADKSAA